MVCNNCKYAAKVLKVSNMNFNHFAYDKNCEAYQRIYKDFEQWNKKLSTPVFIPCRNSNQRGILMYLNIQSLLANKEELSFMINIWKPLIICLSETCLTEQVLDHESHLSGYYFIIITQ